MESQLLRSSPELSTAWTPRFDSSSVVALEKLRLHAAEAGGIFHCQFPSVVAQKLKLHAAEAGGISRTNCDRRVVAQKLKLHAAEAGGIFQLSIDAGCSAEVEDSTLLKQVVSFTVNRRPLSQRS